MTTSNGAAPPPSAFSHPDAAVLTHAPDLDDRLLSATASAQASSSRAASINDLYDVQSTADKLKRGGFKRVAMQFPDEGLPDSVGVFWALKRELGKDGMAVPEMYILADTSYGKWVAPRLGWRAARFGADRHRPLRFITAAA